MGKRVDGEFVQGFLYGDQLNPVAELDEGGTVVSRFVYGTSDHVPDYMVRGGVTYRFVTDHLGSVVGVYDVSNGAVVQTREYDAYGRIVSETTTPGFSQPFGFAGGLWDEDTGLVRFGARDYRPEVGSWAAKDPLRFGGGDGSLFAYVGGDPMNSLDLTGLVRRIAYFGRQHVPLWGDVGGWFFWEGNDGVVRRLRAASGDGTLDRCAKNQGVIPRGLYDISPHVGKRGNKGGLELDDSEIMVGEDGWGNARIKLNLKFAIDECEPQRTGFYIHNSTEPGSQGCVDLGLEGEQWPFWYELSEDRLARKRHIPVFVF